MNFRPLGKTGLKVSEVSFGTWAIGGSWGITNDKDALEGLHYAIDQGVNFFDTADVYGGGHSEKLLAQATKSKEDSIYIATKFCRAGNIHDPETYSEKKVRAYCEASLKRLEREQIDLFQIHCPPLNILKEKDVFEVLDKLKAEGKIAHYGVSVETIEEGLYCLEQSGVSTLQVIFNLLRQKPLEQLFPQALEKGVGILVRLPLASGLLTGKFTKETAFDANDHRNFNRNGDSFNVGETFAGIEFSKGVELAQQLDWIATGRGNMTRASLKWILAHEAVSCVIPGFKNKQQVADNLLAAQVSEFTVEEMYKLDSFYKQEVHQHIRGAY
jgi:aryl-alcohol dehydrogenase-like predicted oxidoreductase